MGGMMGWMGFCFVLGFLVIVALLVAILVLLLRDRGGISKREDGGGG